MSTLQDSIIIAQESSRLTTISHQLIHDPYIYIIRSRMFVTVRLNNYTPFTVLASVSLFSIRNIGYISLPSIIIYTQFLLTRVIANTSISERVSFILRKNLMRKNLNGKIFGAENFPNLNKLSILSRK